MVKKEREYTSEIKSTLEDILMDSLGRQEESLLAEFAGKISVYPDMVDSNVDHKLLECTCVGFCLEFQNELKERGIDVEICESSESYHHKHVYMVYGDVIIDPSIGQFVEGHNHIFVGSRDQLKEVVINQTKSGGKYRPIYSFSMANEQRTPQGLYKEMWGDESMLVWGKINKF